MTKPMILAVLAVLALAITLTSIVSAQQPKLPHLFIGSAGGVEVTAWVDGAQVGSATVADGTYNITVNPGTESWGGKTVSFQIDGTDAAETATFVHGGADELNLTASVMVAAGRVLTLDLAELNDSGQSGTATLTEMGPNTQVVLSLPAGALPTELVHSHLGRGGDDTGG